MKRVRSITLLSLITIFLFSLSSCSEGEQNQKAESPPDHMAEERHMDHNDDKQPSHDTEATIVDTNISKEQAQKILAAYLKIKDALVQTNGKACSKAANGMASLLGKDEDVLLEKIRFDVTHIRETEDPKHQRDHFNTLSQNVYALLKATQANENPIYRQYCPMAFDNKGAFWLAAEEEVNNPYFGDMMLHCGKVEEEI